MWEVITDPLGCTMMRKMLLTIKQHAEQIESTSTTQTTAA